MDARGKKPTKRDPVRTMFSNKKSVAKRLGVEFTIELESIRWPTHCPVLGIELDYSSGTKGHSRPNSPSFDRIDPSRGYVQGNVLIVSMRANQIKSNASPEEIMKVAEFYLGFVQYKHDVT